MTSQTIKATFIDNQRGPTDLVKHDWMSVREVADYTRKSPNAIYLMIHRGELRAYKFGGRVRVKVKDLVSCFKPKGVWNGN